MHVHELNPWKTLIALSAFVLILIIGFITMHKPWLTYHLSIEQSVQDLNDKDACFYPWQLDSLLHTKMQNVILFDIRDNFTFGQGHIPGAENLSAHELIKEESIKRLEKLQDQNITVVIYGEDQLQANAAWMLFRQVGFNNVKVLAGGYQYYAQHKNDLAASKSDMSFKKGDAQYNFVELAAPKEGAVINQAKKKVVVRRRKKTAAAAGGC